MNDETIATVKSKDGHTIELSFWIHKPPALSYFCHKDAAFEDWPEVVGAEGRFVLFRASFASNYGRDEYFMYKAAGGESGGSASLDPLPLLTDYRLPRLHEFGIVPRGGGGGHYLLAALCLDMGPLNYRLHIYSSEDDTWTSIRLQNPCPEVSKVVTSKVITLGDGLLGWVDLHHGILVCDFRQETINADAPPNAFYIPLPDPLPGNKDQLEALEAGPSTRWFRDLTCTDGMIKFIELEHRVIVIPVKPIDPSEKDRLHDSDLIMSYSRKRKYVDDKPKQLLKSDGWRVVTWSRTISCNSWHKGIVVDVADILDNESMYSSLMSLCRLRGGTVVENLAFRDLHSVFPTLSLDDDDIFYLKSKTKRSDSDGLIVAVDLRKKMVKALVPYSFATHEPYMRTYRPCAFPHLSNMTPEHKNTRTQRLYFKDCESDSKRSRLSAERVNHAQNGAQSIVQNNHIPWVRPVQNNMPLQQSITKCYRPCYPGTPWPHQNNPQPQLCFNKWVGPCDPERPAPILHGYVNYQPLWQQPPLSKHHPMSSTMFGPHERHVQELPDVAAWQQPPLIQHQLTPGVSEQLIPEAHLL